VQVIHNQIQATGRSEVKPLPCLGFSPKERSQYSIVRALRNFVLHAEGKRVEHGLELEASQAIEKLTGRSSEGLFIPVSDLQWQKRDVMQTAQFDLGGAMIGTELRDSDFIYALRNRAIVAKLGAKLIADLVGHLDFPRQTSTTEAYWLDEGGTIPESNMTIDLVSLRPKTIAAIVPVTRRLIMQGAPDAEVLVREDLVKTIALGFDAAALT